MKKLFIFAIITIIICTSVSCSNIQEPSNAIPTEGQNSSIADIVSEEAEDTKASEAVETVFKKMSIEEKVWQMFFISPEDIVENISTVIQAGETTKKAIEECPVGGIIYTSQNIKSREQLMEMIKNTQSFSEIPLFISVDEEGGRVSRLGNANIGVTLHPPMAQVGASGNANRALQIGETLGSELTELGFNMDFAPVADVITVGNNEDIGDRSFGKDPNVVAEMVAAQVEGMQKHNLSATLKHFPGNGSTAANTHKETGICTRTLEEMEETEFKPFKAGIEAGADVVMMAHMTPTKIDNVPATLSKKVVTDILRGELGFKGVVISDAMNMGAITSMYAPAEAAIAAINAGVDLILMSPDVKSVATAVIDKAKADKSFEERINESVLRILSLKEKRSGLKIK